MTFTTAALRCFFAPVVFIALTCCAPALKAEDAAPADEAKEAAAEVAAEKNLSEADQILAIKSVRGKLSLTGSDGGDEGGDVIGLLTEIEGDKTYLLKLEKKELLTTLQKSNNTIVMLHGKLRNKGKYLIVSSISEIGGAAAPDRKKRGGI